jgi:hypothetical protein
MERYCYKRNDFIGEFRGIGNSNWEEWQNYMRVYTFRETQRTDQWITLHDNSRRIGIYVSLPTRSGRSYYMWEGQSWQPLYDVELVHANFTDAQRRTIEEDFRKAREILDNTISRLSGGVIYPAPVVEDMKRKVRNVFKINLIDAPLPETPSEAFRFASILANYHSLRRSLDMSIPMVFERDYVGNYGAYVIGINDPTVHFAPKYFCFMSAEQRALTLIHERAHTVFRTEGHPGTGDIVAIPHEGADITHEQAMMNPYCYEWLAHALQPTYDPTKI